jgi:SAM-dependent methyltransferase
MDKRRVYYDHDPVYRHIRDEGGRGWRSSTLDAFRRFLDSESRPETGRALDLGCGGGELAILLAERGWEATGVEFSETALEMARENAAEAGVSVEFIRADVTKPLPIEAGTYTLVTDNAVRHCLIGRRDRMAFMSNAFTALRDGGVMFSVNSCADGIPDYSHPQAQFDPKTRIALNHTRYWATLAELLEEFTSAGFRVEHFEMWQDPPGDFCSTVVVYGSKPSSRDLPAELATCEHRWPKASGH